MGALHSLLRFVIPKKRLPVSSPLPSFPLPSPSISYLILLLPTPKCKVLHWGKATLRTRGWQSLCTRRCVDLSDLRVLCVLPPRCEVWYVVRNLLVLGVTLPQKARLTLRCPTSVWLKRVCLPLHSLRFFWVCVVRGCEWVHAFSVLTLWYDSIGPRVWVDSRKSVFLTSGCECCS